MNRKMIRVLTKGVAVFATLFFFSQDIGAQVSFGDAEKFNDGWLFELSDVVGADKPEYADSTWRALSLPHDWSIEGTYSPDLASCTGYLPGGTGWYRKHFTHDSAGNKGKRKYVYFEGVYNRSEVYLNGHLLGKRPNGYASFMYDLTPISRTATTCCRSGWTTAAMQIRAITRVPAYTAMSGWWRLRNLTFRNGA